MYKFIVENPKEKYNVALILQVGPEGLPSRPAPKYHGLFLTAWAATPFKEAAALPEVSVLCPDKGALDDLLFILSLDGLLQAPAYYPGNEVLLAHSGLYPVRGMTPLDKSGYLPAPAAVPGLVGKPYHIYETNAL